MRKVSQRGLKPFNDIQLYKWGDVCELMQTPRPPMKYMTKTHGRILENLKKFASMNGYCSLSANQIFERPRMFVCLNKAKLVPQKWTGYDNVTPDDYDGVVNPIPKELSVYEEYGYEECPSVPLFKFKVKRPIEGEIEWRDELNNQHREVFSGFQLRVWLHELTHMKGQMITDLSYCNGEVELKEQCKDVDTEIDLEILRAHYKYLNSPQMQKRLESGKGSKRNKYQSQSTIKSVQQAESLKLMAPKNQPRFRWLRK